MRNGKSPPSAGHHLGTNPTLNLFNNDIGARARRSAAAA
jgi:hypothetical protein